LLIVLIVSIQTRRAHAKDKPLFRADLKQFGYITGHAAEYSSIGFLSEGLLLVVINQRVFDVNPVPPATLVLFDLNKKEVSRSASMAVMRYRRSVAPLTNGEFLVLSTSYLRVCSVDLRCDKSFPTKGRLDALNQDTLNALYGKDTFVLRVDGVSTSCKRLVASALRCTTRNKILHPLAIDEPCQPDSRLITVNDNQSGKTLLSVHYNPQNHIVGPALSPDGTKLAIVRDGVLEVYDLP
jgi:hypothetical protein